MNSQNELISIGMPIFNGEKYLKQAVESILFQNYTNIEIIISDDCSADKSLQILQELKKKDNRIRLFSQKKNLGLVNNYNFVLSKARGTYFMWTAQDDVRDKTAVTTLLHLLQNREDAVLAASNFKNVHGTKKYFAYRQMDYDNTISHVDSVKTYLRYDHISFLFGLYKTNVLKKIQGHHVDSRPYFKSSDFLTVFKALLYGPFMYSSKVLFLKRDTGSYTEQFEVIKRLQFSNQILHKMLRYLCSPLFYCYDFFIGTYTMMTSSFSIVDKIQIEISLIQNIVHKCWLFIMNILKGGFSLLKGIISRFTK